MHFLFPLLKNFKSGVDDLGHRLRICQAPGRPQHLTKSDKTLLNFALTLNTAMFADGLWAIKITKLIAGAKKFREVLP